MALTRGQRSSLLAQADPVALVELADAILDGRAVTVLHQPEVGTLSLEVREPVQSIRFRLSEVMVTKAEVDLEGVKGWAMRIGLDRSATLAAAVCDAAAATDFDLAERVDVLCRVTATTIADAEHREWSEVAATQVQFEGLDR